MTAKMTTKMSAKMTTKTTHDFGQFTAQPGRTGAIAVARTRHVDGHKLPDATR